MIRCVALTLCLLSAGCGTERPGEAVIRSLENFALNACDAYDGCTNRCADGREADRKGWTCRGPRRD